MSSTEEHQSKSSVREKYAAFFVIRTSEKKKHPYAHLLRPNDAQTNALNILLLGSSYTYFFRLYHTAAQKGKPCSHQYRRKSDKTVMGKADEDVGHRNWNLSNRLLRTFLASARKVPKESAQRGAELIAPAIKSRSPLESPARIADTAEYLNLHPDQGRNVPISALMVTSENGWAKIGTFSPR